MNKTVSKSTLIEEITNDVYKSFIDAAPEFKKNAAKNVVEKIVNQVFDRLGLALLSDSAEADKVTILNFGTFSVKEIPAKKGISGLGHSFDNPAYKIVKFTPSKALRKNLV